MIAGDAFAKAYDRLDAMRPVAAELAQWSVAMAPTSHAVRRELEAGGMVTESQIDSAGPSELLGMLSALDADLVTGHPLSISLSRRARTYRRLFQLTGKYNVQGEGAVLPRYVESARPRAAAERLDEVFATVRVSAAAWQKCAQINLHAPHLRHLDVAVPPSRRVRLTQVPFASVGDIEMTYDATSTGTDVYVARPKPVLVDRVDLAMQAFVGSEASIGLVPESTLDDGILARWQAASVAAAPDWILVGSGPVSGSFPGSSAPQLTLTKMFGAFPLAPNRAVLMHGKTGEVIAVQDKRYGFTILPAVKSSYDLSAAPDRPLDEGIVQGRSLTLIESRLGRVAILVCEDLDHLTQDGSLLREVGVSLVLTPIIAPPIVAYRWQHQASNQLAKDIGSTVVTFNSLALGRFEKGTGPSGDPSVPANTLIVVEPRANDYGTSFTSVANVDGKAAKPAKDAVTIRAVDVQLPQRP